MYEDRALHEGMKKFLHQVLENEGISLDIRSQASRLLADLERKLAEDEDA